MKKKRIRTKKIIPHKSHEVFVTQAQLSAVDAKLTSKIESVLHELKSDSFGHKSQQESFNSVVKNLFNLYYQCVALNEEQSARNIVVMDGLNVFFARQDRVEDRLTDLENTIANFQKLGID